MKKWIYILGALGVVGLGQSAWDGYKSNQVAKEAGFESATQMRKAEKLGFSTGVQYQAYLVEKEAEDLALAVSKGFKNVEDYRKALELNIPTAEAYKAHLKRLEEQRLQAEKAEQAAKALANIPESLKKSLELALRQKDFGKQFNKDASPCDSNKAPEKTGLMSKPGYFCWDGETFGKRDQWEKETASQFIDYSDQSGNYFTAKGHLSATTHWFRDLPYDPNVVEQLLISNLPDTVLIRSIDEDLTNRISFARVWSNSLKFTFTKPEKLKRQRFVFGCDAYPYDSAPRDLVNDSATVRISDLVFAMQHFGDDGFIVDSYDFLLSPQTINRSSGRCIVANYVYAEIPAKTLGDDPKFTSELQIIEVEPSFLGKNWDSL